MAEFAERLAGWGHRIEVVGPPEVREHLAVEARLDRRARSEQGPLQAMLESMAGLGGERDALTRYTRPLTGAYYFVPSTESLRRLAPEPED